MQTTQLYLEKSQQYILEKLGYKAIEKRHDIAVHSWVFLNLFESKIMYQMSIFFFLVQKYLSLGNFSKHSVLWKVQQLPINLFNSRNYEPERKVFCCGTTLGVWKLLGQPVVGDFEPQCLSVVLNTPAFEMMSPNIFQTNELFISSTWSCDESLCNHDFHLGHWTHLGSAAVSTEYIQGVLYQCVSDFELNLSRFSSPNWGHKQPM